MFAGEGGPARTNERFRFLSEGEPAKRLSTAFDSVTLYGWDPEERPDVWGKIGESGVSVCTLDDTKELYAGFDLCAPNVSVSMTINGPAPIILAFYMNAAIDQQSEAFVAREGRSPSPDEWQELRDHALRQVRGTVQADILKEDQGQNTCIFSIGFLPAHDGRHPRVLRPQAGPELLLGLDQRLSHRRGRGQPDLPARVHARQRLHLRRVLPLARHGGRRVRAATSRSSSRTGSTPSTR